MDLTVAAIEAVPFVKSDLLKDMGAVVNETKRVALPPPAHVPCTAAIEVIWGVGVTDK